MAEITPEMIRKSSQRIMNTLMKWTEGMHELDKIHKIYNEAIDDAIAFVEVMSDKNPEHRLAFRSLAIKMKNELPLMKEE